MKSSVEKKIMLGFVLSLLTLAGMAWLSFRATDNLIATESWVSHTYEVIAALGDGLSLLTDSETSQRGYLLTGDESFAKDCRDDEVEAGKWLENLRRFTADNPAQQARLDQLKPLIRRRFAMLNDRIQLRRAQGLPAVTAAVSAREGKELMDEIRLELNQMRAVEIQLLAARQRAAQARAENIFLITLTGSLFAAAGGLAAFGMIRRDLRLRAQGMERLRESEERLRLMMEQLSVANQQLRAANEELESFSYSVSHDLRAPLRHIDGFVKLLGQQAAEKLEERGRHYLTTIAESARRMGALIDDLLVFSRMGRAELRQTKVAPESLVQEVMDAMQSEIQGRKIVWKLGALPEVEADPAMFRQVWMNLVNNAVKYTRPRVSAEIEIGCKESNNGEFIFFVHDNGVGFDMQYAHKLFGVFQRLHRSEDFEGTGIGLANVSRIIHRHGGRVWAEGRVDAGATFFFSLPKTSNAVKK